VNLSSSPWAPRVQDPRFWSHEISGHVVHRIGRRHDFCLTPSKAGAAVRGRSAAGRQSSIDGPTARFYTERFDSSDCSKSGLLAPVTAGAFVPTHSWNANGLEVLLVVLRDHLVAVGRHHAIRGRDSDASNLHSLLLADATTSKTPELALAQRRSG
jgi:hypothetical protein